MILWPVRTIRIYVTVRRHHSGIENRAKKPPLIFKMLSSFRRQMERL